MVKWIDDLGCLRHVTMPPQKGGVLTFVNTTTQPSLTPSEARRVRGHVTKVNFARRRERLGIATGGKPTAHRLQQKGEGHSDHSIVSSNEHDEDAIPRILFVESESIARLRTTTPW